MVGDSQIIIGASIGIATGPHEGATSDDLLRHADLALYAAKQAGRGAYRFYEASMRTAAETRRSLEMDLSGAVASDQLAVGYRSGERRVGEECVRTGRSWLWAHHYNTKADATKIDREV